MSSVFDEHSLWRGVCCLVCAFTFALWVRECDAEQSISIIFFFKFTRTKKRRECGRVRWEECERVSHLMLSTKFYFAFAMHLIPHLIRKCGSIYRHRSGTPRTWKQTYHILQVERSGGSEQSKVPFAIRHSDRVCVVFNKHATQKLFRSSWNWSF